MNALINLGYNQVTAQKAIEIASNARNDNLATVISKRLQLYKQKKPYQESVQK